jgi:hypothetical protein
MVLFFFHVIGSNTVQDETGQQLVDAEDAKTRARRGARRSEYNRSLITAVEGFAYMLDACPCAFINIGIAGTVGGSRVHNPHCDFNAPAIR